MNRRVNLLLRSTRGTWKVTHSRRLESRHLYLLYLFNKLWLWDHRLPLLQRDPQDQRSGKWLRSRLDSHFFCHPEVIFSLLLVILCVFVVVFVSCLIRISVIDKRTRQTQVKPLLKSNPVWVMLDVKNISPNFLAMVYMYLFEVMWCWDYKPSLCCFLQSCRGETSTRKINWQKSFRRLKTFSR